MSRSFHSTWMGALAVIAVGIVSADALATPNPTSAVIRTRIFNDCPSSTLTTNNSYPGLISILDEHLSCNGYANLHNWRFSEDGANPVAFGNNSNFTFSADLMISGTGNAEAGLQIAPWWSQDVDGRFNVRTPDGEIACFGGRLPFYSFTGNYGLHYVNGDVIHLAIEYLANDLTPGNPATAQYSLVYNGNPYASGPLAFDEGNPSEDPPYGLWGMLNDGRVGGYIQCFIQPGNDVGVKGDWRDIKFTNLDQPTPVRTTTWGSLKMNHR